jgi:hypothetical protein
MKFEEIEQLLQENITETGENTDENGLQYKYIKIEDPVELSFNYISFPEGTKEIRY